MKVLYLFYMYLCVHALKFSQYDFVWEYDLGLNIAEKRKINGLPIWCGIRTFKGPSYKLLSSEVTAITEQRRERGGKHQW